MKHLNSISSLIKAFLSKEKIVGNEMSLIRRFIKERDKNLLEEFKKGK